MSAQLSPLPPGVRAETHTYANGKTDTVYRAPFESDGPRIVEEHDRRVLCYMFAAYVFRWPESSSKLDVGHGAIDDYMDVWSGVLVTGRWHPSTLTEFAQRWTAHEMRKFAR